MGNNIAGCMTCRAYHHPREPGALGSCRYNPPTVRVRTDLPSSNFPAAFALAHPAAQTQAFTSAQALSGASLPPPPPFPINQQTAAWPTAAWPTVLEDDWCWRWPAEIPETAR